MTRSSDLRWARQNGGRLSRMDKVALVIDVLKLQASRWQGRRTDIVKPLLGDVQASIRLPDSSIVLAAMEECREVCRPIVFEHCLRTFAWGSLIGAGKGLSFDRESFAVSALLHDIEIGRTAERAATGCACFACAGGLRAERFCKAHGKDAEWARVVGDAIAMHLDPVVPISRGAEAHLLQAGAAVDVIGVGLEQISPRAREAVLGAYPRDGFKRELLSCMEREAAFGQRTRMDFFMSRGFGRRIVDAPLP